MIYTMNIDRLSRCPNAVDSAKVLVDTRRKAERWAKCSINIIAKPHDGGRGRRKPRWVLCNQPLFQLEDDLQSAPAVIRPVVDGLGKAPYDCGSQPIVVLLIQRAT